MQVLMETYQTVFFKEVMHPETQLSRTLKAREHSNTHLWIAKPEIQTSKFSEKAEACEENPVLKKKTTNVNRLGQGR